MDKQKSGIKKLIIGASCVMLLATSSILVAKASPMDGMKAKVASFFKKEPIDVLKEELQIHAAKAFTEDGRYVDPYLDHDCAFGPSVEPNDFGKRFYRFCEEHQIEEEVVRQLVASEPELFPQEKDPISETQILLQNGWELVDESSKSK